MIDGYMTTMRKLVIKRMKRKRVEGVIHRPHRSRIRMLPVVAARRGEAAITIVMAIVMAVVVMVMVVTMVVELLVRKKDAPVQILRHRLRVEVIAADVLVVVVV